MAEASPYDARYSWQREYFAAILETNNQTLKQRILNAERLIVQRLEALAKDGYSPEETDALRDALVGLKALKNERA